MLLQTSLAVSERAIGTFGIGDRIKSELVIDWRRNLQPGLNYENPLVG